jgi:hypothetical protein
MQGKPLSFLKQFFYATRKLSVFAAVDKLRQLSDSVSDRGHALEILMVENVVIVYMAVVFHPSLWTLFNFFLKSMY